MPVPRAHALGAAMLVMAANALQAQRTERMRNLDPSPHAKAGRIPADYDVATAVRQTVNAAIQDHAFFSAFKGEITQLFDEGVDRAAGSGETDACNLYDAGVNAIRDEAIIEEKEAANGSDSAVVA